MTAQEAQEWETFNSIVPFPHQQIIDVITLVATIFANGTLKKKNQQPWIRKDFLMEYFKPEIKKVKPQKLSAMKTVVQLIGVAFGSKKTKQTKEISLERERNKHRIKYEAEKYIPKRTTPPVNPIKRNARTTPPVNLKKED